MQWLWLIQRKVNIFAHICIRYDGAAEEILKYSCAKYGYSLCATKGKLLNELLKRQLTRENDEGGSKNEARRGNLSKQAEIQALLRAKPHKGAVSLFLLGVRSLEKKRWIFYSCNYTHHTDCCVVVLTETWLCGDIFHFTIQLDGLTFFHAHQEAENFGKTQNGGLCVYEQ